MDSEYQAMMNTYLIKIKSHTYLTLEDWGDRLVDENLVKEGVTGISVQGTDLDDLLKRAAEVIARRHKLK